MKFTRNKKQEGQAVAEFALLLPILVMFIVLGIQFAILLNAYLSLTHLSRAAARYATVNFSTDSTISSYVTSNIPGTLNPTKIATTVSPGQGTTYRTTGYTITVNVGYDMTDKMFIPSTFSLGTFTLALPTRLTSSASMRIEGQ